MKTVVKGVICLASIIIGWLLIACANEMWPFEVPEHVWTKAYRKRQVSIFYLGISVWSVSALFGILGFAKFMARRHNK